MGQIIGGGAHEPLWQGALNELNTARSRSQGQKEQESKNSRPNTTVE